MLTSLLAYCRSTDSAGHFTAWKNPRFSLVVGASVPEGVSRATMLKAVRSAARAWNDVGCAAVSIRVEDSPSALAVSNDGVNAVISHLVTWCADERGRGCHDALNPAITTTRVRSTSGGGPATIYEADVEINAVDYRWDRLAAPNGADLQAVLTHELGHALGLADACRMPGAHPVIDAQGKPAPDCVASPPDVRASVMWPLAAPNDVRRRILSADDRKAICALYPRKERH